MFFQRKRASVTQFIVRKVQNHHALSRRRRIMRWMFLSVTLFVMGALLTVLFTRWGMLQMKSHLDDAFEHCPPEKRAAHWSADMYLTLAWWEGTVLKRHEDAAKLYREFLAIGDADGRTFWNGSSLGMWGRKFNPDTRTGWGPLHPRACEAYYDYLDVCEFVDNKNHVVETEGVRYFTLFHNMYPGLAGTATPHPKFYRYWERVASRYIAAYGVRPPLAMHIPPNFEGPD